MRRGRVGVEVETEEDMAARTSALTVVGCFVEMRWCSICIVEFCKKKKKGGWGRVEAVVSKKKTTTTTKKNKGQEQLQEQVSFYLYNRTGDEWSKGGQK